MRLGSVYGIAFRVNPLFLLIIMVAGLGGYFVPALVLLGLILSHELAHIIVARSYGVSITEIELMPFGGVARTSDLSDAGPGAEQAIALAGPLNNFLLLAGGLWLKENFMVKDTALLDFFIEGNLSLSTFNLLPVLPLDGGRFLRNMLSGRFGYARATRLLARAGQVVGVVLIVSAGLFLVLGFLVPNGFALGLFLLIASTREVRAADWRAMKSLWKKQEDLMRKGFMPLREVVIYKDIPLKTVLRCLVPQMYHRFIILGDDLEELGGIGERRFFQALIEYGPELPVGDILKKGV